MADSVEAPGGPDGVRRRSRPRGRPTLRPGAVLSVLVAMSAALLIVSPFIITLTNSLMTMREAFTFPPTLLPREPRWDNYVTAWTSAPFARYFLNSIFVATAVTAGQLFTSILAAFAFARMDFRGAGLLFGLFLATLMIPGHVLLIPNYLTLANFGMINTYWALILPSLASGFTVFLIRQHFKSIPKDLEDAARIDGAGSWTILWRVLVPLAKPVIAAAGLFVFLGEWNAYLWPLIVTDTDAMRTVTVGLASFVNAAQEDGRTNWPVVLAASMLVLAPTLIAFAVAERQLVKGITLSGIKG